MTAKTNKLAQLFSVLFGALLGLSLLKFGNPCVLEKLVEQPKTPLEWLINPWPVAVGFGLLGAVVLAGIFVARRKTDCPRWLAWLPMIWLAWQFVSATHTVSWELTRPTLLHFTACVVCFYLGLFALPQAKDLRPFFVCLLIGLVIVITCGWQQRFGGLDETRKYFFTYLYPQMPHVSPEYLKKISSNRIFSTLFYPNALAGVLLLLLPLALVSTWRLGGQMTEAARGFLVGLVAVAGLACLVWSGSKAGWLFMLALGLVAVLQMDFNQWLKMTLLLVMLAGGLAGFGLRYAGYFKKGATSATARMDYWRAAAMTATANPEFGTGPGTFPIPYAKIKAPDSEMARLVHNDFLQQASDSGAVGFLAYTSFVVGALLVTLKKVRSSNGRLKFAVWLGLSGWGLQSMTEFGLYIPALAWIAFALLGWLLADGNEFDTSRKNL